MSRKRKNYSGEEKVAIFKRHLVERVAVSDLCDEHGLHPTVFYRWQKEFFEKGASAFVLVQRQMEFCMLKISYSRVGLDLSAWSRPSLSAKIG